MQALAGDRCTMCSMCMVQDCLIVSKHRSIERTRDAFSVHTTYMESKQMLLQISLTMKFLASSMRWCVATANAKKALRLHACVRR